MKSFTTKVTVIMIQFSKVNISKDENIKQSKLILKIFKN